MILPLDPDYVPSPVTAARLEIHSWYALLGNLNELRLEVDTEGRGHIAGDGYTQPMSSRFTALIWNWEAKLVPEVLPELPPGHYHLSWRDSDKPVQLYTPEGIIDWQDCPAVVHLWLVDEEE